MTTLPRTEVVGYLQDDAYNRQRINPQPEDSLYLHLSDLREFLRRIEGRHLGQVLDYGCGGSPYQPLIQCASYKRADYLQTGRLDYVIGEDCRIGEKDAAFDTVLSTQVLEHVADPSQYLGEARRLLKPGGTLILTTHGLFEDHGCPYDFRRWTADGLHHELEASGFRVEEMWKLTTGPRAVLFFSEGCWDQLWHSRKTMLGWAFWLLRRSFYADTKRRNEWIDQRFPNNRVVESTEPRHPFYVALGAIATRP